MEQITAEDSLHGNSRAMKKLVFILRARDDKWFVHLVAAAKECQYKPILDDVNPRLEEAGHVFLFGSKILWSSQIFLLIVLCLHFGVCQLY